MSFKAQLEVGGKKVNVLDLSYSLMQKTDDSGRPSAVTRGGEITLTVESTGETTFFEWMVNNFERKDGTINFTKRDSDATMKSVKFKEGYVVKYRENFNASSEYPITETFTISAKELTSGTASHINEWPV